MATTRARSVFVVSPEARRWRVELQQGPCTTSLHDSKQEALEVALERAICRQPSRVELHEADGSVECVRTFEPESPRDERESYSEAQASLG